MTMTAKRTNTSFRWRRSRHDRLEPGDGSLALGRGPYPLLLELKEVPEMARPLDVVREVFDRLENLPAPEEK